MREEGARLSGMRRWMGEDVAGLSGMRRTMREDVAGLSGMRDAHIKPRITWPLTSFDDR